MEFKCTVNSNKKKKKFFLVHFLLMDGLQDGFLMYGEPV